MQNNQLLTKKKHPIESKENSIIYQNNAIEVPKYMILVDKIDIRFNIGLGIYTSVAKENHFDMTC